VRTMDEVIFAYTRRQAIADGVLRDVSELAKEAGFRVPVAVTAAVWVACVAVPDSSPWQDEKRRLWSILDVLRQVLRVRSQEPTVAFWVLVQNDEHGPKYVALKATSGPGDNGEHVVTVMLPDED